LGYRTCQFTSVHWFPLSAHTDVVAAETLLSNPEQVLYGRLTQASPSHIVLAQVQLLQALRFTGADVHRINSRRFAQLPIQNSGWD
jgi:hypothetical protein